MAAIIPFIEWTLLSMQLYRSQEERPGAAESQAIPKRARKFHQVQQCCLPNWPWTPWLLSNNKCALLRKKKSKSCCITFLLLNFPHIRTTCQPCVLKWGFLSPGGEPVSGLLKFKPHTAWHCSTQDTRLLAFEGQMLAQTQASDPPHSPTEAQHWWNVERVCHPKTGRLTFSSQTLTSEYIRNENTAGVSSSSLLRGLGTGC